MGSLTHIVILTGLAGAFAAGMSFAQEAQSPASSPPPVPEPAPAASDPPKPKTENSKTENSKTENSLCLMIESAARAHELPVEFFARVIWQESRFRADAIGPMTRSGQRAQGMAQFMPGTAAERGLLDPFDPVQALPKSAEFLSELRAQFGNLGLAAAAYNAGPRRVGEWLEKGGVLPQETRSYVAAITGMTVDEWAALREKPQALKQTRPAPGCGELIALLRRAPNPFVEELEQRVARGLAQPWGVQLAAGFSRQRALTSYARAMTRYNRVLEGYEPGIQSTLLRSRGTRAFYQVRIGTDSRAAADALCAQLRRVGGACLVLRNKA